jgi:hypothetical protein
MELIILTPKVKQSVKQKDRVKGGTLKMGKNRSYFSVPGGIRTHDPLLRRQPLYPLSYRDG